MTSSPVIAAARWRHQISSFQCYLSAAQMAFESGTVEVDSRSEFKWCNRRYSVSPSRKDLSALDGKCRYQRRRLFFACCTRLLKATVCYWDLLQTLDEPSACGSRGRLRLPHSRHRRGNPQAVRPQWVRPPGGPSLNLAARREVACRPIGDSVQQKMVFCEEICKPPSCWQH